MRYFSLEGRVALITGGSKGLGKACALALSEAGARTVLISRHFDEAERAAHELKAACRESLAIQAGITIESDIENMVQRSLDHFGQIDILVNNAGTNLRKPVLDYTRDD